MADYILRENRKIHVPHLFTHGETLFDHWREKIHRAFGQLPIDSWGCAGENFMVASQCEQKNLYHFFEPNIYVDFRNRSGTVAEVFVTSLNHFSMPLINYEIGDLVELSEEICPCGRHLKTFKRVMGRNTDIVTTPSRKRLVVHLFTGLFEYAHGIKHFQVIQEELSSITIRIVKKDTFSERELDDVLEKIQEAAGYELQINIECLPEIPQEKSEKTRIVKSKIPYFGKFDSPQMGNRESEVNSMNV
jgi:phenylacetate-CoA ligase